MHPELEEYLRQLDAIRADARQLVAGLSDAEFNRRPAAGRWSAAECLDHLNTVRKTLPAIDRAITSAAARGLRSDGPFRYGWFARWMIRSFEPPPRRRSATRDCSSRPTSPWPRTPCCRSSCPSATR